MTRNKLQGKNRQCQPVISVTDLNNQGLRYLAFLQGVRKVANQAIILMLLIVLLKMLPQMIRTYMTCLSYLHSLLLIHKLIVACFS